MYALLKNLLAAQKPSKKSFQELSAILWDHFEQKPVVTAERFHFHRKNQTVRKSVAEYLAELHRLATHYEFKDHCLKGIRDWLVCSLRSGRTQKNRSARAYLMLAKAVEVAQSMKSAETNEQQLKGQLLVGKVASRATSESSTEKDMSSLRSMRPWRMGVVLQGRRKWYGRYGFGRTTFQETKLIGGRDLMGGVSAHGNNCTFKLRLWPAPRV